MDITTIYPWVYLVSLTSLCGWALFPKAKGLTGALQTALVASLGLWVLIVISTPGSAAFKLLVAFRDLIVLSMAGLVILQARSNKIVGIGVFVLALVLSQQLYLPVLRDTWSHTPSVYDQSGELLIDLNNQDRKPLQELLSIYNADLRAAFSPSSPEITDIDEYYLIDLPASAMGKLEEVKQKLLQLSCVDWVEDNEVIQVHPVSIPAQEVETMRRRYQINDPEARKQWILSAFAVDQFHQYLNSLIPQKKEPALVAIIDTGVEGDHEDLRDQYQSLDNQSDKDAVGHGTHVAGIIGARTNNGVGIASLAPDDSWIRITSVKVLNDLGFGSQATIIRGMLSAADQGVDVISMSLGGPSRDKKQEAYRKAVEYCNQKGSIVIVAAGNANVNAKTYAPANTPGVMTVTAIDQSLKMTSFSNGVQDLQRGIAAPGDNIHSTYKLGQYRTLRGTSMAAPFVSAVVGIFRTLDPSINTERAYQLLAQTGISSNVPSKSGPVVQPLAAVKKLAQEMEVLTPFNGSDNL